MRHRRSVTVGMGLELAPLRMSACEDPTPVADQCRLGQPGGKVSWS